MRGEVCSQSRRSVSTAIASSCLTSNDSVEYLVKTCDLELLS